MSIFPYSYQMVESFNITADPGKIAVYTGLITASFAFAEFLTGMMWGRLSDKVGRKPVLIGGLIGTALSMTMFGFARSLPVALVARALGGALNGYGIRTDAKMRADKLPETSAFSRPPWRSWSGPRSSSVRRPLSKLWKNHADNTARAYSIMPFIWSLGYVL
jgi:MFS family permease